MPYTVRINPDETWDLEAPNGTVIEAGNPVPVSEGDIELWMQIVADAQLNQRLDEAITTVAVGIDIIDES